VDRRGVHAARSADGPGPRFRDAAPTSDPGEHPAGEPAFDRTRSRGRFREGGLRKALPQDRGPMAGPRALGHARGGSETSAPLDEPRRFERGRADPTVPEVQDRGTRSVLGRRYRLGDEMDLTIASLVPPEAALLRLSPLFKIPNDQDLLPPLAHTDQLVEPG